MITTKTGDKGYSRLYGGRKLRKDDPVFEALGSLDELSSLLGVLIAKSSDKDFREVFTSIQKDLYRIMAFIGGKREQKLELEDKIKFFEQEVERISKEKGILKRFILPQGSEFVAFLHFVRAVARRAERRVVAVCKNEEILKYLNRLSDFLFAKALEKEKGIYV